MKRSLLLVVVAGACGGKDASAPSSGPAYTPGLQYAFHTLAPDCKFAKPEDPGIKRRYDCGGAQGTLTYWVTDDDHVRHLVIDLTPTTLGDAKVRLVPVLTPILGKPALDQLDAAMDKLAVGDNATLELAGGHVHVEAKGPAKIFPEYVVDLRW